MFRRKILNLDVALIQVSPPDEHGFCTLGPSVDTARAAIQNARYIIGKFFCMPITVGCSDVRKSMFSIFLLCALQLNRMMCKGMFNLHIWNFTTLCFKFCKLRMLSCRRLNSLRPYRGLMQAAVL